MRKSAFSRLFRLAGAEGLEPTTHGFGDQQIGAMLANGELGLIIFLRDPLTAQPHEPDVSALLRLCDVQKIPLATNVSSAIIMLEALKNGTFQTK